MAIKRERVKKRKLKLKLYRGSESSHKEGEKTCEALTIISSNIE